MGIEFSINWKNMQKESRKKILWKKINWKELQLFEEKKSS